MNLMHTPVELYVSRYATLNNKKEMNVNGSSKLKEFIFRVVDHAFNIGTIVITIEDGAALFANGDFGAISGALKKGLRFVVDRDGSETELEVFRTNRQLREHDEAHGRLGWENGDYSIHWEFSDELSGPLTLHKKEILKVQVRDDLRALDHLSVKVIGSKLTDEMMKHLNIGSHDG